MERRAAARLPRIVTRTPPTATVVEVTALIDPELVVEIEVEAWVGELNFPRSTWNYYSSSSMSLK